MAVQVKTNVLMMKNEQGEYEDVMNAISGGTGTVTTDKTLTQEDVPADAKAVGDRFVPYDNIEQTTTTYDSNTNWQVGTDILIGQTMHIESNSITTELIAIIHGIEFIEGVPTPTIQLISSIEQMENGYDLLITDNMTNIQVQGANYFVTYGMKGYELLSKVKDEVSELQDNKMERYVIRLVKNSDNTYKMTSLEDEDLTFEEVYNVTRKLNEYVVVLYGNSKLRPQYVSENEMMFVGIDRSTESKILRILYTPTRLTYETFRLAEYSDIPPRVELDTTLTVSGKASDSKAVGDKINELKDNVAISSSTQPTEPMNKIWLDESTEEIITVPDIDEFNEVKTKVDVDSARIDTIVSSATVDSEVQDIRVGADGTTYTSAGQAVREQVNLLAELIDKKNDDVVSKPYVNFETSPITDSDEGTIKDLICKGKAEQKTTQGYQLIDFANLIKSNTTVNYSFENDTLSITAGKTYSCVYYDIPDMANKTVTLSCGEISGDKTTVFRIKYMVDGVVKYFEYRYGKVNTFEIPPDATDCRIQLYSNNSSEEGDSYAKFVRPMVEYGDTAHDFEPYTGGIPSPNPDYPQEIEGVTEINISVSNGEESQTEQFIPPRPLYKIGTATDKLDVEKGVWEYETAKTTFESMPEKDISSFQTNYVNKGLTRVSCHLNGCYKYDGDKKRHYELMATHFYSLSQLNDNLGNSFVYSSNTEAPTDIYMYFPDGIFSTKGECAEWFNSRETPVEIVYRRENPTTLPINAEDLERLKSLMTYKGVTNISITDQNGRNIESMFRFPMTLEGYIKKVVSDLITPQVVNDATN